MIKELYCTAKNLVYENRCAVCYLPTANKVIVCHSCDPRATLLPHSYLLTPPFCLSCGESLTTGTSTICESCILFPLPIGYVRSIWGYTGTAESLICAFKYRNSRSLSIFLAAVVTASIQSGCYPPAARYNWDLILPLPSTGNSLGQRGFSPVAEIVKLLSKNLKIPSSLLGLKTIGTHPAQASLSPNERLKHIKGKFKATAKTVANKRLLLIDDVITSGASIVGATTALLESGAANIDCLSICRSDLFTQLRQEIHLKIPHKFNRLAR